MNHVYIYRIQRVKWIYYQLISDTCFIENLSLPLTPKKHLLLTGDNYGQCIQSSFITVEVLFSLFRICFC